MIRLKIPYTEIPVPPSEAFPNENKRYIPTLLTTLEYQGLISPFWFHSVIDSGADNCIFPAIYGRRLNIQVETGKRYPYFGATGSGLAYFHQVKVLVEVDKKPYLFSGYCGFTDGLSELGVGLLGRHGFFDLFKSVVFKQTDKIVELELPEQKPQQIPSQ